MRAIKRWRYYCDFCKKAGMSCFHMQKHENSCTLNPARVCRMCQQIDEGEQAAMSDMLALLPDLKAFEVLVPGEDLSGLGFDLGKLPDSMQLDETAIREAVSKALPKLRELTNDCPVCIMAAFRQKGIPLPVVEDFNFADELKEWWVTINEARSPAYY